MLAAGEKKKRRSPKGGSGGRYGFNDYPDSPVDVIENEYQVASACPCCQKGKLYEGEDRQGIQYDANPPLQAKRHLKKVLRCNACGKEQVPSRSISRHTNAARSSVVVQRALGMPLNRLSRLQGLFGVPVAASTLWKMSEELWDRVAKGIFEALCHSAKGGEIFGGDDTTGKILEVQKRVKVGEKIRKGCYTSSICTRVDGYEIALYFTSNKYLAENFTGLFADRADGSVMQAATAIQNCYGL